MPYAFCPILTRLVGLRKTSLCCFAQVSSERSGDELVTPLVSVQCLDVGEDVVIQGP